MNAPFTVACAQMTSGREISANIEAAGALIGAAAKAGADFVLLPETVNLMESNGRLRAEKLAAGDGDGGLAGFRDLAAEITSGCWPVPWW